MSRQEFEALFPDGAACAEYLVKKRWPQDFSCAADKRLGRWTATDRHGNAQSVGG